MRQVALKSAPSRRLLSLDQGAGETWSSPGRRMITRHFHRGAAQRLIRLALSHPCFPHRFFSRNLTTLATEPGWRRLPMRLRKLAVLRLLWERSRFFLEVAAERDNFGHSAAATTGSVSDYCDHCGECCEIASGLPEFPTATPLPKRWRRVFGQGLGRWHRFCPFLWQANSTGQSLCAIHPWRPLACRAFEKDECDYLKDPTTPG